MISRTLRCLAVTALSSWNYLPDNVRNCKVNVIILSKLKTYYFNAAFLARDSIYAIARYMPSPVRLSVRPSVRHTGGSVKDG